MGNEQAGTRGGTENAAIGAVRARGSEGRSGNDGGQHESQGDRRNSGRSTEAQLDPQPEKDPQDDPQPEKDPQHDPQPDKDPRDHPRPEQDPQHDPQPEKDPQRVGGNNPRR